MLIWCFGLFREFSCLGVYTTNDRLHMQDEELAQDIHAHTYIYIIRKHTYPKARHTASN